MSDAGFNDLGFIGFGEAASAFVEGWDAPNARAIRAYDIKTDHPSPAVREGKQADYARAGVTGCGNVAEALAGRGVVFSMVTADQALAAAASAVGHLEPGAMYLDCNSCAPNTKRRAAALIEGAGGRYVDVAVMGAVHPTLHRTPVLFSGPHGLDALEAAGRLGMSASVMPGEVGAASSVKMIRSVMIKGMEALAVECVLAGRKAGVDGVVLDSLQATFPEFDWRGRVGYMLERVATHGLRRAAEMREVALTVEQLGLGGAMAHATAAWQQRIGDLQITDQGGDYADRADAILERLHEGDEAGDGGSGAQDDYHDIPGTYVFDAEQSRKGYHLNMFCMSLRQARNREAFKADEPAYLDRFPMTPEQRQAVLERRWNEMLRLGGNIYYTAKLAATDGITFQDLAAVMTGVTLDEYRRMMINGGRPIDGNRSKSEWQSRGG